MYRVRFEWIHPLFLFVWSLLPFYLYSTENCVLVWNQQATRVSHETQEPLPHAARALAILQTAVYDTVQVIKKERQCIYVNPISLRENEGEMSVDAAVTAAAHRVLSQLYPRVAYQFDAKLIQMYAELPDTSAKKQGILLGREVADKVLAWRARDFETALLSFKDIQKSPERWKAADGTIALVPNWSAQPYFVIESEQAFPLEAPPVPGSQKYAEEYYHVKRLGSNQSHERLLDHTAQGAFFGRTLATPVVFWNGVARLTAKEKRLDVQQSAHLLALLNVALSDSVMSSWKNKYHYMQLRPEEAIHLDTETIRADKEWKPFTATPNYPDYPSAHASCAGSACVVLQGYVGDDCYLSCNSCGEPASDSKKEANLTNRRYGAFSTIAKESVESRLYGGVCFPASAQAGQQLGRRIAYYVLENSTQKIDDPS